MWTGTSDVAIHPDRTGTRRTTRPGIEPTIMKMRLGFRVKTALSHSALTPLALLKATRVNGDVPRLAAAPTRRKEGREELGRGAEDI